MQVLNQAGRRRQADQAESCLPRTSPTSMVRPTTPNDDETNASASWEAHIPTTAMAKILLLSLAVAGSRGCCCWIFICALLGFFPCIISARDHSIVDVTRRFGTRQAWLCQVKYSTLRGTTRLPLSSPSSSKCSPCVPSRTEWDPGFLRTTGVGAGSS